jgi:pyruvate kinase
VAKIEKPQALDELPAILDACDAIMVARGDLGVELAPEKVPCLQKEIIHAANRKGVPVITATQMLESMIDHPRPTRAEASDVANAIFDGTDAVMLSGETAVGRYPVETVEMMDRIAREAESSTFYRDPEDDPAHPSAFDPAARAMAWSARRVARETTVRMIVVYTLSGRTAQVLSKLRPGAPIVAMCPDEAICRKMSLLHGVLPLLNSFTREIRTLLQSGDQLLLDNGLVDAGERVVVLGGTMQIPGATNLLQLRRIERV